MLVSCFLSLLNNLHGRAFVIKLGHRSAPKLQCFDSHHNIDQLIALMLHENLHVLQQSSKRHDVENPIHLTLTNASVVLLCLNASSRTVEWPLPISSFFSSFIQAGQVINCLQIWTTRSSLLSLSYYERCGDSFSKPLRSHILNLSMRFAIARSYYMYLPTEEQIIILYMQ